MRPKKQTPAELPVGTVVRNINCGCVGVIESRDGRPRLMRYEYAVRVTHSHTGSGVEGVGYWQKGLTEAVAPVPAS